MVKPLVFKGEKKPKKRKHHRDKDAAEESHKKQQLIANDESVAEDDTWVSAEALPDVAGPVLVVLPSTTPTALACDANGTVFAVPIENIVDGNPSSAEPHDVRQVWVASRIVGTEHFRFKGHHGKYLGCDKYGLFSATAIAVSPLESFQLIETDGTPETFQIKTLRDTYLSVQQAKAGATPEIRGDATETNLNTTVRIRMQARFKPKIKASKEEKAREKISRRELEDAVGRRLEDDEVKLLKKARREGDYHEKLLDVKVRHKHDKYG